jgi:hypothetical protein
VVEARKASIHASSMKMMNIELHVYSLHARHLHRGPVHSAALRACPRFCLRRARAAS